MVQQIKIEMKRRQSSEGYPDWLILIPNIETLINNNDFMQQDFIEVYDEAPKVGIHFVIGAYHNFISTNIAPLAKYLKNNSRTALISMKLSDQNIFDKVYNSKEKRLLNDETYLHHKNESTKLKLVSK